MKKKEFEKFLSKRYNYVHPIGKTIKNGVISYLYQCYDEPSDRILRDVSICIFNVEEATKKYINWEIK